MITHGTATLEETAYFLNLTLKVDATVVLVGSQRPATGLSSDAGLNLLNAVRVAGSPEARGLGVLVLLNDEIQTARDVTQDVDLASRDVSQSGPRHARLRRSRRPHRHLPPAIAPSCAGHGVRCARADRSAARGHRGVVFRGGWRGDSRVRCGRRAGHRIGLAPAGRHHAGRDGSPPRSPPAGSPDRAFEPRGKRSRPSRTLLRQQGIVVADNLTPQKARVLAMLAPHQDRQRVRDPAHVRRVLIRSDRAPNGVSGNEPSGQKLTRPVSGRSDLTV